MLDQALTPVSSTAAARSWLDSFPDARMLAAFGMLPAVIYPAAATARSGTSGAGTHAIVQSVDRRWVMIEAAKLEGHDGGQIAVTLRAATATETFDLLCRAYALSQRERQVVAALVAGLDTRAITQRLFISRYTVQDHLKSVFTKTGVRSRRELLARFSGANETTRQRKADAPPDAAPAIAPAHVASPDERGTSPPSPAQPLLHGERASRITPQTLAWDERQQHRPIAGWLLLRLRLRACPRHWWHRTTVPEDRHVSARQVPALVPARVSATDKPTVPPAPRHCRHSFGAR